MSSPSDTSNGLDRTDRRDRLGEPFQLAECGVGHFAWVLEMYDTHIPEAVAQGLPPTDASVRGRWLSALLERGCNFAASIEGKVAGHSVLLPNPDSVDGEYIVFVGGPFRKRGLATILTETAIKKAGALGLKTVWLTVESDNFRAIKLYRKVGFTFCDKGLSERKMAIRI